MYTLIDDNWMHLQGGGCFELPYMSIVDYNNISFQNYDVVMDVLKLYIYISYK